MSVPLSEYLDAFAYALSTVVAQRAHTVSDSWPWLKREGEGKTQTSGAEE